MSQQRRPYGLTEADYATLENCRNVLRMAQFYCAASAQGPMEPELLFSFYQLLDDKLTGILSSAEAGASTSSRRTQA